MVAIGRALMANPDLILFDEISLGLAPIIIKDIYKTLVYDLAEYRNGLTDRPAIPPSIIERASDSLSRQDISRAYFGIA